MDGTVTLRNSVGRSTALRFAIYTTGITLLGVALPWIARHNDASAFKENGLVEWLQFSFLILVSLVYLREATRSREFRSALLILACFSTFAGVREMDASLDLIIPILGWKVGYVFILVAGWIGISKRESIHAQATIIFSSRAFAMLWAGFIVSIPFAQLVGNAEFMFEIMSNDYTRDYPRVIEEIGELLGYGLLLLGSLELVSQLRSTAFSTRIGPS